MHVIAGASPDNTPAGYYWTFLFPMLLFIVSALILWALFGRPHHRVPAQRISLGLTSRRPEASTARAAAVAGGLTTAPGGGTTEAAAEPAAAHMPGSPEPEPPSSSGAADDAQPPADGAGAIE